MNDAPGYRDWRIGTHRAVAEPCGALRLTYAVSGPRPQPPPGRLTALRGCSLANDWRTPPVASPNPVRDHRHGPGSLTTAFRPKQRSPTPTARQKMPSPQLPNSVHDPPAFWHTDQLQ